MSRRTRFLFPRFCRLMKNRNGKKRTRPWDTNKENTECSSFCLRIQVFFFILTNTGTGKLNTDGLLRLQHKDLQIDSSRLQNYVRRSESRQALDLGGVFSLRVISREPASERTSFYRSSDFISDSMRSLRTVSLQRWGWKWVVVVSYLNDLFDSYVQEQLILSHFIVISAGPGKERTPNGQVSKWESLSRQLLFYQREGGRWRIERARTRRAPDLLFFLPSFSSIFLYGLKQPVLTLIVIWKRFA